MSGEPGRSARRKTIPAPLGAGKNVNRQGTPR
jgi:hypothetical protein